MAKSAEKIATAAAPQAPATPQESTALVAAAAASLASLAEMEALSGGGFEDVKASDLALPQVKLLQSTSAQTKAAMIATCFCGRERNSSATTK